MLTRCKHSIFTTATVRFPLRPLMQCVPFFTVRLSFKARILLSLGFPPGKARFPKPPLRSGSLNCRAKEGGAGELHHPPHWADSSGKLWSPWHNWPGRLVQAQSPQKTLLGVSAVFLHQYNNQPELSISTADNILPFLFILSRIVGESFPLSSRSSLNLCKSDRGRQSKKKQEYSQPF